MPCSNLHDRRLSRKKAAHYIGEEVVTLNNWARTGKHLKYTNTGNQTYYEIADLDAYLKDQQTF